MLKSLVTPNSGKLRVAGLVSGSGASLKAIIDQQQEMSQTGDCPYEVVAVFSDNPRGKAIELSRQYGLPLFVNDIRAFYTRRGHKLKNRDTRIAFDQLTAAWLKLYQPDVVAYAGYVWATTPPLADGFIGVNVHPADLSVVRSECRAYAGAHGVRDALLAGEPEFRSSAHLVTTEVDGGPLLMLSEPVPYEAQMEMPLEEASRYYLRLLNQQSRRLFARVIRDMAEGRFQVDARRNLHHDNQPIPSGICM